MTYEESPLNAIAHIKAGGNGEYQLCKAPDCEDDNQLIWHVIQRRAETVEEMGESINSPQVEQTEELVSQNLQFRPNPSL